VVAKVFCVVGRELLCDCKGVLSGCQVIAIM